MGSTKLGHITLWTQHEIDELTRLYNTLFEGVYLSHRTIGAKIGKTRNAIIGKVHRLGLYRNVDIPVQGIDTAVRTKIVTSNRSTRYSLKRTEAVEAVEAPPIAPECVEGRSLTAITILEATDDVCRFPIGDVGHPDFHLCGAATKKAPYCAFHASLCFRPVEHRRRDHVRPSYRR